MRKSEDGFRKKKKKKKRKKKEKEKRKKSKLSALLNEAKLKEVRSERERKAEGWVDNRQMERRKKRKEKKPSGK